MRGAELAVRGWRNENVSISCLLPGTSAPIYPFRLCDDLEPGESAMNGDPVERPVAVAALLVLLTILAIEGVAVAATFRQPQAAHATARSLINYVVERLH
jgi:hypothetical protein